MEERVFSRDIVRFYGYLRPYFRRATFAVALTFPAAAIETVIAYLLKPYANETMVGGDMTNVWHYPFLIVIVSLVQGGFKYSSEYYTTWVGKRVANDLKLVLYGKMMHNDCRAFDSSSSGDFQVRYNQDADVASESLFTNIHLLVFRTFSSLCLMIFLIYTSPTLAAVAITALGLAVVPMARVKRRIKEIIAQMVATNAKIATDYIEAFNGNRVVAAFNLHEHQKERLLRTLREIFRLNIKMTQRAGFLTISVHFIISIGIAGVVWLAGYLITSGAMTPGDFVAFIAALILLFQPVRSLGGTYSRVQTGFSAIARVLDRIDDLPEIRSKPGAIRIERPVSGIRFDKVFFSYEPGKPVLKGVDLEVGPGQSVAFVGNSGGGKTTMVNLLPRFYDVDSGVVSVNGVDVRDADLESLRDLFAIVFQDNFLFGGTIRDNVMLGRPDAGADEVAAAVRAACLEEFVASLPKGLDTVIGERGVMLSGGQKQRVGIARAFLKDAPVVILDEATSALDNQSEKVVQQAIENLMRNKTVFIIAHRLSTVVNADRIMVLKEGEIVESGTHAELVAKGGVYAALYRTNLQNGGDPD